MAAYYLPLRSVYRREQGASSIVFSSCVLLAMFCLTTAYSVQISQTLPLSIPCEDVSSVCGRPVNKLVSRRIIGGTAAGRGAWPWMVALQNSGQLECGGALISSDIVLTASHCFLDLLEPLNLTKWSVVAGASRMDIMEPTQRSVKIKQVITHEDYDRSTVANDIALVVLEQHITYTSARSPICLPQNGEGVTDGEMCYLAGWGATRGTGDPDALNQVALPIISDSICAQPDWYGSYFSDPDTTFCAGYERGLKDGCTGDSGGPLVCNRGGVWYLQGISSWGFGCAERKWPGVYTEVDKYAVWISNHLQELRPLCDDDNHDLIG